MATATRWFRRAAYPAHPPIPARNDREARRFLRVPAFVEVDEDGVPLEDAETNDSTDEPPSVNDRKSAWVDYAVAQGMARDEADDLTKSDLTDRFGR